MKRMPALTTSILLVAATAMYLSGCFKDTATRSYKIFTPVYKTSQEVRNGVQGNAPIPVSNSGKMYLFGNYIFLNEVNRGIHIIDNSNPSNPVNRAFINIPGNVDIAVKGNSLYADCFADLFTLDISNINSISLKSCIKDVFPERRYAYGIYTDSNHIIVDWLSRDTSMNLDIKEGQGLWHDDRLLTNVGSPWLFSTSPLSSAATGTASTGVGGSMARFAIVSNYLYAVTTNQLKTVDIGNGFYPQLTNSKNIGWQIETIYPFKDKLFIGSQTGMYIFDLSSPNNPVQGMMFGHARACDPVIADDNYAYVTLHSGNNACWTNNNELNVIDIQNLSIPSLLRTYPLTNPKGLSKQGNILFICDGNAGLKVFDATDASNILLKKTITMQDAFDVIALPSKLAIVSAKGGLYQYGFNSATDVSLLSRIPVQ